MSAEPVNKITSSMYPLINESQKVIESSYDFVYQAYRENDTQINNMSFSAFVKLIPTQLSGYLDILSNLPIEHTYI